jgi:ubiquinone/menaquinone biosynthesis C-methylase UbiE
MKAEFDQFAKKYREDQTEGHSFLTGEDSHYFARYKAEKLKEWLPFYFKGTPQNILDFGCGDGMMTEEVRLRFPKTKIYGTDPSSESIDIAKKNYSKIDFQVSTDNLKMFKKHEFDVVFCAGVFHHIPFKEHQHYMKEVTRVLRPGGTLILFELNPLNPGTSYIFRNHPMEVNAKMLKPWYAKKLTTPYGKTTFKSYGFFPHFLKALRPIEPYITQIPFGGLYAIIMNK